MGLFNLGFIDPVVVRLDAHPPSVNANTNTSAVMETPDFSVCVDIDCEFIDETPNSALCLITLSIFC